MQQVQLPEGPPPTDDRLDFIQDFTLKSLRLKPDKWHRLMISDDSRNFLQRYIETNQMQVTRVDFKLSVFCLN